MAAAMRKGCRPLFKIWRCQFSTATSSAAVNPPPLTAHRTMADPNTFTTRNIGQWYTIPVAHLEKLLYKRTLPPYYVRQVETLLECSIMVRRPYIDMVNCLKHTNADAPVVRYVLYGPYGTGKSVTLWQAAHWAHANGWIVCHIPLACEWTRCRRTEITPSVWRPDRFDLPLMAQPWLSQFKATNEALLNQYEIRTTKDYTWTARENTPAGSPLMSLVDLGIARPKLASDCMGALCRELKQHAKEKKLKLMVAIDMVNSFYVTTLLRRPDGVYMHASEVSIIRHMTKLCKNDWNNGAVVTTVCNDEVGINVRPPHWPYYLLGQEGFEALDPFVPLQTTEYTDHEAYSVLDYFTEMNWIQRPGAKTEEGRKELVYLSAKNPYLLERTIAAY